ncbi:glycosyltransferase [Bradyrhizobium sp. 6(2017)]|uniref:glycosyltransferase n=1 Tax=Bradyrhizobium sp. 6(2017) TaxID=1197460 RepID=UPI0013E1EC61|nr:glycosyltransferase family 4 protein [Bradyrhizobium sp. 6(2017)]
MAMPNPNAVGHEDNRVVRLSNRKKSALRIGGVGMYRWLRRYLFEGAASWFRYLAVRFVEDPEKLFFSLYSDALSSIEASVFVAIDLPVLPVTRWAAERSGAALIYDSHELFSEQELSGWEKRKWRQIEKKHIGACDQIITVNESIARELESRYSVGPVHVVYNAVRLRRDSTRSRVFHDVFGLSPDAKIALYQGGLSPGRNLEALIKAFELIDTPNLHLVLLGDGEMLRRLKARVDRCRLRDRVHFHPAVPQDVLLSYTAAADIGVIPYQPTCLNNLFCTPNKLFEYVAASLPIVSSDLPEIRRIVQTHDVGMLGDMSSPRAIATLIDGALSCPDRLESWRLNLEIARKILCWEREEEKIASLFAALTAVSSKVASHNEARSFSS